MHSEQELPWGPFDLSGWSVVVTGAGGHLGRSITEVAARAGADVVAVGRRREPLEALERAVDGTRGRVHPLVADIGVSAEVDAALELQRSLATRGVGLVNNAYAGTAGSAMDYDRDDLERTFASLSDTMMLTQRFAVGASDADLDASIVNIASMYGHVAPSPAVYGDHPQFHNPAAYGAMKAALVQFTRYAAVHLAPKGVRVNSVSPGPFPGDSVQVEQRFVERLSERAPLGRIGERHEVGAAVTFLLSGASSYITGEDLAVDGGWTAW
ncbi:MAG: SDR family oxidoreductase [Acidimicrobiia bacterium]|nr:SDR family oxidoreductase [Acidimicrobiia bacterium]